MSARLRPLAALPLVLALFACATAPRDPFAADRRSYADAVALENEDRAAAAAAFEKLLRDSPDSPVAVRAGLELARLRVELGDPSGAVRTLHAVLLSQPDADGSDEARLVLARMERDRGRSGVAYRVLSEGHPDRLPPAKRREALRMLADLSASRRDPVSELRWLAILRADTPDEDQAALVDVEVDQLAAKLGPDALLAAADAVGDRVPAGRLRLDAAAAFVEQGDFAHAGEAFDRAARSPLSAEDAKRSARIEARLRAADPGFAARHPAGVAGAGPATVATPGAEGGADRPLRALGVVLPLSGPLARFGEQSLEGVLLAADVFSAEGETGSGVPLLVRDSAGKGARAAGFVGELAADPRVGAIVGPLLAEECDGAAAAADAGGVPLLALTAREEVTQGHRYVLRLGATPRDQTEALAAYATLSLGAKRFGVLYPDDPYGKGLRDLFRAAIEARGGAVVATQSYVAGSVDFSVALRKLAAAAESGAPAGGRPLDALFVPDGRERIAKLAPQLPASPLAGVPLLGPAGWRNDDLVRAFGVELEGAVVAEPFDPESLDAGAAEFTSRFRQTYAVTPDLLSAQAFDAASLALAALQRAPASRDALLEQLHATHDWDGAAGRLALRPDGNADRRPTLLGVRSGRFVTLPNAE